MTARRFSHARPGAGGWATATFTSIPVGHDIAAEVVVDAVRVAGNLQDDHGRRAASNVSGEQERVHGFDQAASDDRRLRLDHHDPDAPALVRAAYEAHRSVTRICDELQLPRWYVALVVQLSYVSRRRTA